MLTHIDLFSGIGGFALAAQWAGFKTLCFVEIEPYAQELIKQNFGAVADAQRLFADIRKFDGTRYRGATLLTGGFPCQPFSQAGKRRGKEDDRYLWPEMLRVIHEARPAWVLGENVAGIVAMELDRVLSDLEGEGYAVQPLVIPACAVDAKHRRDRVWIIANDEERRWSGRSIRENGNTSRRVNVGNGGESEFVADPSQQYVNGSGNAGTGRWDEYSNGCRWQPEPDVGVLADGLSAGLVQPSDFCQWPKEPPIPRVATGVKNRVDQLKGLGNAIVAQVAYEIIKQIAIITQAERDAEVRQMQDR